MRIAHERNLEAAMEVLMEIHGIDRDYFEETEVIRKQAISEVTAACALSDRAWVKNGRLVVSGTRDAEFKKRLARYNRVPQGQVRSLAAFYFQTMFSRTRESKR